MRRRLLAPRRRATFRLRMLLGAAALGVGSAATGCAPASGGGGATVTATGTTLRIYAGLPAGTPGAADTLDAERLALAQSGGTVGKYRVALVPATAAKASDNARTAIEDTSSIAYLGESVPGLSANTIGITNAQDLLQVSPGDTALELTESTPVVPRAPNKYYEALGTYHRTFARVVPSTLLEARAQVQLMSALGVKKVYIASDGTPYGAAIAAALRTAAAGSGGAAAISAVQGPATASALRSSGADALFYGAARQNVSAVVRTLATIAPASAMRVFTPSTFDELSLVSGLGAEKIAFYVSAPGFQRRDLPPAGQTFMADFMRTYGHAPAAGAIFAYEAMQAVLDVLREAGGKANDRGTVVKDFFAIRNRPSVLGTYSINANGDTNLGPFVFSRLNAGTLRPFRSVQVQG